MRAHSTNNNNKNNPKELSIIKLASQSTFDYARTENLRSLLIRAALLFAIIHQTFGFNFFFVVLCGSEKLNSFKRIPLA